MIQLNPHLKDKSHIIWDWNGTLLNDTHICVDVIGEMLESHQLEKLSSEKYRDTFRFPIIEYYRNLGFNFEKVPFEVLADDFMNRYRKNLHKVSLYEGTPELLGQLKEENKTLSILSAAKESDLHAGLKRHNILHFFDHIFGLKDHFAATKIERGKELLKHWGGDKEEAILVGDTDHDIEVANELGIEALILADGHQSFHRLEKLHPKVLRTRK